MDYAFPAATYRARCSRVIDGDTVELVVDLGFGVRISGRFRLEGVDGREFHSQDPAHGQPAVRGAGGEGGAVRGGGPGRPGLAGARVAPGSARQQMTLVLALRAFDDEDWARFLSYVVDPGAELRKTLEEIGA